VDARATVKALTPPILLALAKRILGRGPGLQRAGYYDQFYAASEEYAKAYPDSVYYPVWTVVSDRLTRAAARSVLDLGCGPGQFAELLRDKAIPTYCGIDFSVVSIQHAKERCPGYDFIVADLADVAGLDLDYDWALALEVLEHIEDDIGVLGQLKPGTRVILTVPNFPDRAHVRVFSDAAEVERRYGHLFEDTTVDTFKHGSAGLEIFLLEGRRR
jgi:trans-aconitate methyltransferase